MGCILTQEQRDFIVKFYEGANKNYTKEKRTKATADALFQTLGRTIFLPTVRMNVKVTLTCPELKKADEIKCNEAIFRTVRARKFIMDRNLGADMHNRTRQLIGPFECDYCQREFAYRSTLTKHMKLHMKARSIHALTVRRNSHELTI